MTRIPFAIAIVAAAAGLAGCATPQGSAATADLRPTTGNSATGIVRFAQAGGKVVVSGEVRGLKPNADHGFHVHEKGDCSSGDGMSTGGHFNPDGKPHGMHGQGAHHVGDLPALKADAYGVARFSFESVHRDPDDYRTQPTGNAGPRLACAVIRRA
jgi:Cu-Zn family superoxide dismutase